MLIISSRPSLVITPLSLHRELTGPSRHISHLRCQMPASLTPGVSTPSSHMTDTRLLIGQDPLMLASDWLTQSSP